MNARAFLIALLLLLLCNQVQFQRINSVLDTMMMAQRRQLSNQHSSRQDAPRETTRLREWSCTRCKLEHRANDGADGLYMRSGRGVKHFAHKTITVEKGAKYYMSVVVKSSQVRHRMPWNEITLKAIISYRPSIRRKYVYREPEEDVVAVLPYLRPALGWQVLAGDFVVQNKDVLSAEVQVVSNRRYAGLHIANLTLTKLEDDHDWRTKANRRIDQFRKNNITFRINIDENLDPSKVKIYVNMTKHLFPFGSCLRAKTLLMKGEAAFKYRQFFYDNFGWGVLCSALKWKQMEKEMGEVDFLIADTALQELESHGIPLRGHCITWGSPRHNPAWLLPLNGSTVEEQVTRRMDYLLGHYKGRLKHWDVNNEDLHGDFFEIKSGNPDIMARLFHMAHARDPTAELFTNDYNIVNSGAYTEAYVEAVRQMVEQGVPIYGMGTQSHLRGIPDITLLQNRLEVESSAGLPIWITELDITHHNVSLRAQAYEDVLRLYFSTPAIEGIVMWGYWDKAHWRPQAALVEGDDFRINEAGERVIRLYKQEWSTNVVLTPTDHEDIKVLRAFHGNYTMTVMYDGSVTGQRSFMLQKGRDLTLEVNID